MAVGADATADGVGAAWPLIGRDLDVAHVVDAIAHGRGVALTGEAGIGKTRLAHAVMDRLATDGWTTASFEAGPGGGAVPFLPFASLLRTAATENLQRIVDAADELVARGARVAALVDDAHALDEVSLAFISHLLATTDVRLVLTVRSGDEATRLVRAWSDALPRVDVTPLDRALVDQLVQTALGPSDPVALRWIWDTAAGNPLFVRELVADAVARGALVERDGRWMLGADARPPGRRLRDVVVDRFGALWDSEREAVELLAVAEPIALGLFEKLTSPDVVQELEHRGLITADRSERRVSVRLAHRIHSEVVREQLGPSTVAFHRRRLLDAMSSLGERRRSDRIRAALWRVELGDTSDPDGLLSAAAELLRLVDGGSASARQPRGDAGTATGPEMLGQAAQLARAALDAGAGLPAAVELLAALSRLGRHADAQKVRASLGGLVADEADRVLVTRLLAEVDALVLGDPAIADARLRELEAVVTSPDQVRSLRATRTMTAMAIGEPRIAIELARSVLDDDGATAAERVRTGTAAAVAFAHAGLIVEGLELLDRTTALAAEIGEGRSFGAVFPRIIALACSGRLDELDQLLSLAHRVSEQHGLHDGVAIFASAQASAAMLRGRPRTALACVETTMAHLGAAEPMGLRRMSYAIRAEASAVVGDLDAASEAIADLDTIDAQGTFSREAMRAQAWVLVPHGRTDDAVSMLIADAITCAERGFVVAAVGLLHDVARLGQADRVASRVAALAAGVDGPLVPAQAAHVAALVAGDADAIEAAGAAFADLGANLAAAEAYAQAAASHRVAGRHGRASTAAGRSRELAEQCEGATSPALANAEPLLALTKREREIVVLAAEGLSNRDIADRLIVSVRTVHTHLYNAFAKLGVESRDDLSAAIASY